MPKPQGIVCPIIDVPKTLRELITSAQSFNSLDPVTVVAPSLTSLRSLRHEVGSQGLFNVNFTTLTRIAAQITAQSFLDDGLVPLSHTMKAAILMRLTSEISGELSAFSETTGLRDSLRSTFISLSDTNPDSLSLIRDTGKELSQAVLQLYEKFTQASESFYDTNEIMDRAISQIPTISRQKRNDFGTLIFYLAPHYSPRQIELIRTILHTCGGHAIVGSVGERPTDSILIRIIETLGIHVEHRNSHVGQFGNGNVHLVLNTDATEEIRHVTRKISAASEDGTPFYRMAVLYGQEFPYHQLIEDELSLADIPMFVPSGKKLKETSPGKTLAGLLDLIGSELPRHDLMNWISNCPVDLGYSSLSPVEWDSISRAANVVSGRDQWIDRLLVYAKTKRGEPADLKSDYDTGSILNSTNEEVKEIGRLITFIEKIISDLSPYGLSTWQDYTQWLWNLLTKYLDESKLSEYDFKALSVLEDRINGLIHLDKIEPKPDIELLRLFVADCLNTNVGQIGRFGSGVFVGPMRMAVSMSFDLTFITGLSEGSYPATRVDEPFLPDWLRSEAGGSASGLPTRNEIAIRQRYEFLAMLRTSKECVLSAPRGDLKEQRSIYPSKWFLEIASNHAGYKIRSTDMPKLVTNDWLTVIPSKLAGIREASSTGYSGLYEFDLSAFVNWVEIGNQLKESPLITPDHPIAISTQSDTAHQSKYVTAWDGDISSEIDVQQARESLRKTTLSATMLETYATCPYKYFLRYKLGIKGLETPEDTPDRLDARGQGTLLHHIFQEFHQSVINDQSTPGVQDAWSPEHKQLMRTISERSFKEWEDLGNVSTGIYWDLDKEYMTALLDAYLNEDQSLRSGFQLSTVSVEQPFGFPERPGDTKESWSAPTITIPNIGSIKFRGYIDRIDANSDGSTVMILDLKTGSSVPYQELEDDVFHGGTKLQLPVYLLAAQQNLPDAEHITAAYWMVSFKGKYQVLPSKPLSLEQPEGPLRSILVKITDGITSGLFPANPGPEKNNCKFCDYDAICPALREGYWDNKSRSDIRLADYLALSEQQSEDRDDEDIS